MSVPPGFSDGPPPNPRDAVPALQFDWTKNLLMAGFIPAFVAFTLACQETIQSLMPDVTPSSVTFDVPNGNTTTPYTASFAIRITDSPRVWAAWGLFVGLVLLGCVWAFFVITFHAMYYNWPVLVSHPEAYQSNTERMQMKMARRAMQEDRDEQARRKKFEELDSSESSYV